MIKIHKLRKPDILSKNEKQWTEDCIKAVQENDQPKIRSLRKHLSKDPIKRLLREETHNKCAYCESYVLHIDFGDIDHIMPLSKFPEKAFEWTNLVLTCSKCNNNKTDYHSDEEPLVHPINDEPVDHIGFLGELAVGASANGIKTQSTLELNRPELLNRRKERLKSVERLIRLIPHLTEPTLLKDIENTLEEQCRNDQEYSRVVLLFIRMNKVTRSDTKSERYA